jgi:hypothetical protein
VTDGSRSSFDLSRVGERRVAVAGDWHGNVAWVQRIIPALHRAAPDVRTILHAGDFGILPERRGKGFLTTVDYWCRSAGIEKVLVTPGNHEDWSRLGQRFASRPGEAIRLSETVWVLPRGLRFHLAGRLFMSFGGAASLDFAYRRAGRTWWPTEMPTAEEVAAAMVDGNVEVLVAHETINGGTARVESVIRSNPFGWDEEALEYSRQSRGLVTEVWEAVRPDIFFHGHIHLADRIELPTGQQVVSLGSDRQRKNIGLLNLDDLTWSWID